jgi:HD-GYP domain-containing protein (c-di-GMP phosphodiesterase class II)
MNYPSPKTGEARQEVSEKAQGVATPAEPLTDEPAAILYALALAVEQRDSVTGGHCERLALTSLALGVALCLDRPSLQALYRGGFVHDIGKVGIPDAILFKPGPLTAQEWTVMRSHPARGEEICRHLKSFAEVLPIIRHHHERWDGTGYPDGLRGDQIPLLARVLQVADIYDALTNSRPYKPAFTPKEALGILAEETACGWRDPEIVDVFKNIHGEVIVKLVEYSRRADRSLDDMSESLANLRQTIGPGVPPIRWRLNLLDSGSPA